MDFKDIGKWKCNRCNIIITPCTKSYHNLDMIYCSELCQSNIKKNNNLDVLYYNKKIIDYLIIYKIIQSGNQIKNFNLPNRSYKSQNNLKLDIESNEILNENRDEFYKNKNKYTFSIVYKNYNLYINKTFSLVLVLTLIFFYFSL